MNHTCLFLIACANEDFPVLLCAMTCVGVRVVPWLEQQVSRWIRWVLSLRKAWEEKPYRPNFMGKCTRSRSVVWEAVV